MNTKGILLTTLGVGVAGGASAGTYFLWPEKTKNEDIESKLKASKYEILDKSSTEWEEIVKSYKTVVSNNKDLQIDNFDGTDSTGTQPERKAKDILSEKCHKIIKEKASNNADYKKAEKWCIKPQDVAERLKWLGYEKIDTTATTTDKPNANDSLWDQKIEAHKNTTENKLAEITEDIGKKATAEQRPTIKDACEKISKKKTYEIDYESSLAKAQLWCSNKKESK